MEEQRMGVRGGACGRIEELMEGGLLEKSLRRARAESTNRRYDSVWGMFEQFCGGSVHRVDAATILAFVWWLEASGRGGQVESAVGALKAKLLDKGLEFLLTREFAS